MWMNAPYKGVDVDRWRSIKEHFMIRYRGKTETTTFCHQLPKLVLDKTETVSDFAERCIREMREFVDPMPLPADRFFSAGYLALPAGERTQARNVERRIMMECLATGCFLMGVTTAIRTTLMQHRPAMLSEAIQEAMSLELVKKTNGAAKNKIASLADLDDEDLVKIEDLNDVTITAINFKRAKSGRQPFLRPSQFAAPQEKEAKAKAAETSPPQSVASARKKDICSKSATLGSKRTPPVWTGTASQ
jgi:hypothetical protein